MMTDVQIFFAIALTGLGVARAQHDTRLAAEPRTLQRIEVVTPSVIGGIAAQVRVYADRSDGAAVEVAFYSHSLSAAPFTEHRGTIPADTPSQVFTLPTLPVPADTTAKFSVRQIGASTLTVLPGKFDVQTARVSGISLNPSTTVGGKVVTGTVVLTGIPAPSASIVNLASSDSGVAQVSQTLTVSPNSNQATFQVITQAVPSNVQLTIIASRAGSSRTASLIVMPPDLAALNLFPEAVADIGGPQPEPPNRSLGGYPATGVVELDGPSPVGGLRIDLSSDNTMAAETPGSITIPEGAWRGEFGIITNPVAILTDVTIGAIISATGRNKNAALTIAPAQLTTLTVSPNPAVGGQHILGSISLDGLAPSGGVQVLIANDNPTRASTPTHVTIEPGKRSALFPIDTIRVADPDNVGISASLGSASATATLKLIPSRRGDANGDRDVDIHDYLDLVNCSLEPTPEPSFRCRKYFDFDRDRDIDLVDMAGFQQAYTGSAELGAPPVPTLTVDPTLAPALPELLPLEGAIPRPLACLTDNSGVCANFVENEIMVIASGATELEAFRARWNGDVLRTEPLNDPARPGALAALLRVDTTSVNPATLVDDLMELSPGIGGELRVSSPAGARLLAATARERRVGTSVALNLVPLPSGFSNRQTTEGVDVPSGERNTFCWNYLNAGSNQDIGVTEAWRALELTGRLISDSVRIAIIDAGFRTSMSNPNPDFPDPIVLPNGAVEPRLFTNRLPCSDGGNCLFHGNGVLSAAMSLPDNGRGSAGPAGPVGKPVLFVPNSGFSDFEDFVTVIFAVVREAGTGRSKIFNLSGEARLPAVTFALVDTFEDLLRVIVNRNVVIFASAGNQGTDVNEQDCFVACWEKAIWVPCELDQATCVGGLFRDSKFAHRDSNFGTGGDDDTVDIWAPFTVWSDANPMNPTVHEIDGTSVASPYVAGVAALVWAADPGLTGGQVLSSLISTATSSPDIRVNRIVNAFRAVVSRLPSAPPDICIVEPSDGTPCMLGSAPCPSGFSGPTREALIVPSYQLGTGISLRAQASDPDQSPSTLSIEWRSDLECAPAPLDSCGNVIARGMTAAANGLRTGRHRIRATVIDSSGIRAHDEREVNVINTPPTVDIGEPINASLFCEGQQVNFRAQAWDVNHPPLYDLSDAVVWQSDREGVLGVGRSITRVLVMPGHHVITASVRDSVGAESRDFVNLEIIPVAAGCQSIDVRITQPPNDTSQNDPNFYLANYDSVRDLRYVDVVLEGVAWNDETGSIPGSNLQWSTNRTDLQVGALGTGHQLSVRLYGCNSCINDTHTITLRATDSNGNSQPTTRVIRVWNVI